MRRWRATLRDEAGKEAAGFLGPASSAEEASATLDKLVRAAWLIRAGTARQPWLDPQAHPDPNGGAAMLNLEWDALEAMRRAGATGPGENRGHGLAPERSKALADAVMRLAAAGQPLLHGGSILIGADPIGAGDPPGQPRIFLGQIVLASGHGPVGDIALAPPVAHAAIALALHSQSRHERHFRLAVPGSATLRAPWLRELRASLTADAALVAGFLREAGLGDDAAALEAMAG